jgi:hypothetical protein
LISNFHIIFAICISIDLMRWNIWILLISENMTRIGHPDPIQILNAWYLKFFKSKWWMKKASSVVFHGNLR